MTRRWYKVDVTLTKKIGKKHDIKDVYIFAFDIEEVLQKRSRIPGTRHLLGNGPFPHIRPLSKEESNELRHEISHDERIDLYEAERNWYYRYSA